MARVVRGAGWRCCYYYFSVAFFGRENKYNDIIGRQNHKGGCRYAKTELDALRRWRLLRAVHPLRWKFVSRKQFLFTPNNVRRFSVGTSRAADIRHNSRYHCSGCHYRLPPPPLLLLLLLKLFLLHVYFSHFNQRARACRSYGLEIRSTVATQTLPRLTLSAGAQRPVFCFWSARGLHDSSSAKPVRRVRRLRRGTRRERGTGLQRGPPAGEHRPIATVRRTRTLVVVARCCHCARTALVGVAVRTALVYAFRLRVPVVATRSTPAEQSDTVGSTVAIVVVAYCQWRRELSKRLSTFHRHVCRPLCYVRMRV